MICIVILRQCQSYSRSFLFSREKSYGIVKQNETRDILLISQDDVGNVKDRHLHKQRRVE